MERNDVPERLHRDPRWPTRRSFLATAGVASAGVLAGCVGSGDGDDVPEPAAIEDGHSCWVCNMIVVNHPGPSGHAIYPDGSDVPGEQDGIVPYCSSSCAYEYYFEQKEAGVEPLVIYLTDYSTVDWEVYEEHGAQFITAHFGADAHTDSRDLDLVVDSDVLGAMGESLIGFSDSSEAEEFADQYGGDIYDHDSVTRELVESLGFV